MKLTDRTAPYSPTHAKNSTDSTGQLYEARKYFIDYTIPFLTNDYWYSSNTRDTISLTEEEAEKAYQDNFIPLSDLYGDRAYYGTVDTYGNVIAPQPIIANFTQVGFDNKKKPLYLLDFVGNALLDMVSYLNIQLCSNCSPGTPIPKEIRDSPFYNMVVKKSYSQETNIEAMHTSTIRIVASKFREYCLANKEINSSITNFDSFMKYYIPFVKTHLRFSPITKSRLMLFYNYITFNNGIMFSFSEKYSDGDQEKIYKDLYLDVGFKSFAKACIRFGFFIDKNNPFILHADLGSPAMKKYMSKVNLSDTEDAFEKRYTRLFTEDLESIKIFFIDSYNVFLYNNTRYGINYNDMCSGDFEPEVKERTPVEFYERNEIYKKYPDTYWMKLYVYFKNYETNSNYNQKQFDSIVRIANNFVKSKQNFQALKFVNMKFNEMIGVPYFDSLRKKPSMIEDSMHAKKHELILW